MLSQDDEITEDDTKGELERSAEESSSEETTEDLAERVKGIDLTADNIDVENLLKLLSKEEKREFHRQIATGSIYSSVPVWTPWWQSASRKLIASFPDDLVEEPAPSGCNSYAKPLSMLISKAPHASIIFSLAETLLGYAFVSRFFNGDHLKEMRRDACDLLLRLVSYFQSTETTKNSSNRTRVIRTSTPSKMIVFSDFSEVIASLQSRLAQNHLTCSHNLILLLTDDMHCMLQKFDSSVTRALNELLGIFSHVKAKNNQLAVARHKLKFLLACIGKQDEASRMWFEKSVPTLVCAVEASICEQSMRIETENRQTVNTKSEDKSAGPNWRSIIRDNTRQNNVQLIEEVNLPNVPDTAMQMM
nr:zinc finger HIT domain containing protein 2 [Hymenolepis microstoma]